MSANAKALLQTLDLPLKISKKLCQGKSYIVVGANVGLGLEASRHLVQAGAGKVIMTARNLQSGEAARADIETSTGIKGVAEVWHLDLASHDSVRSFANKSIESLQRIEAIIENAAVALPGSSKDEIETVFTVNVTNTFLLTMLLLPKLRSDAKKFGYTPRIAIVESGAAFDMGDYWKKVAEDPLAKSVADESLGLACYPASKLLGILAGRELARLLPVSRGGVIINIINPGLCVTSLSRNAPPQFQDHLKQMWEKNGRTAECGSRTLVAGAVAGEDSHGSYMNDCVPSNDLVPEWMDDSANQQAWAAVAKELEKVEPGSVSKALA